MEFRVQYVYECICTWKQEIHLSHSCSDLDAADNRLANKLAEQLAQDWSTAAVIESELHTVGANDLWPVVKIRADKLRN